MPFIKHPKTKVTLFVGQKSYDEHQAAEKKQAEQKKAGQKKYVNPLKFSKRETA